LAEAEWRAERLRVPVSDWLEKLDGEYLSDYIRSGGSAVKVVSGAPETLSRIYDAVRAGAPKHGYFFTHLDPSRLRPDGKKPDLHRIDRFFFEATRDVDWKEWAAKEARGFLESRGIHIAPHRALNDLEGIAADNDRDSSRLHNLYENEFAKPIIRDHRLVIEFRTALTALTMAQLIPDVMTPTTEEVLLEWLAGRTMPGASAALKRIQIFGRIDRSNARHMLASFCRWLPRTGRAGLIAVLDFRTYEHKRKSVAQRRKDAWERIANAATLDEVQAIKTEAESEPPVSYSQAAYMQMLQMIRRFINEID
jgi:hypothetical protein